MGLTQPISPELSFVSELQYKIVHMEPLSTGQRLSYADNLTSLSAGVMKSTLRDSWHINLGSRSTYFVRSTSLTSYRLDSVSIPFLSAGLSKNLYTYKSNHFGVGADATYLSASKYFNYKIKPGFGYQLRAESVSNFATFSFGQQVYFSEDSQDSTISSQSFSEIGLRLILRHSY